MKKKISVLLFAFTIIMLDSQASNWYVDNAVSNSGNGQSWAKAFRQFSDIAWTNVHPGDFIYISGGSTGGIKTYTESWTVGASGTAGNPITIAVDAANRRHNGRAVFDYDSHGDTATVDAITINKRSYITINGNVNGQNHIAIKNLRNIESNPHGVGEGSNHANGFAGRGNGAIIIDHIDVINCNNPVRLSSGSRGNEIMHSNFMQVRGDAAILLDGGANNWDANLIHDNYIELLQNSASPPGEVKAHYGGPDGIQTSSGISIYRNTFKYTKTTVFTSTQHPDLLQLQGNYIKIYDNEFINIADSGIDYDTYANPTPHDVWIYNNVFRIVQIIDSYPEYFRFYNSMARPFISINNFKILNNTFIDNTGKDQTGYLVVRFNGFNKNNNPTGLGNEIKNNIFYNCGNGAQYQNIYIAASTGFTNDSFTFDANVYYNSTKAPHIYYNGTDYSANSWIAAKEPHGKISAPAFVSYSPNDANNNLHLAPTDKVAKGAGISLGSYFTEDKDGIKRAKKSAWSIGAYE